MEITTNSDVRANNRKRVANLLFTKGEMTKQEIVKHLDMSLATVNYLVKELTEMGLFTSGAAMDSTGGRKPICIQPVYGAKYSIGVEATADVVRLVALDLGTHVIAQESYEIAQESTLAYWKKVGEIVMEFGQKNNLSQEALLDVGITLGITMQDEIPVERKKQSQEFDFDIDLAREGIGMPVHFRNSTKMAAVAHCWHGDMKENFIYIYIGAKVSAAMVFENQVMDFARINGEMGCMLVGNNAEQKRLDSVFSRRTLCKNADCKNLDELFDKIQNGDAECKTVLDEYLDNLANFLYNLYCMFGWKIILGGTVSPFLKPYLLGIEEKMKEYYPFEEFPEKMLDVSWLGIYASAVGAAMIPIDHFLEDAV